MNNKFSENLKKIRKDNNLSQEQLADKLGVSRQAISKWESAVAYPEMDKIITLCEKFNLNIDDLLHKDIREVKGEEESKKNLNNYVDDFLNFITNTINMFSNMSFKSKCKCLFEQLILGVVLFIVFLLIGAIAQDLISGIFGLLPNKIYSILYSILHLIYVIFAVMSSIIIVVHIFKTRYLNYYEKIKREASYEKTENDNKLEQINKNQQMDKKNKILFKKNEDKIIIRDPKDSEYKFINGMFKVIIGIVKFLTISFSMILFISLISLFCLFIVSFLIFKTGLVFIGLLIVVLSAAIINIIFILLSLNFVFNRKNDKKKMIWSFIISLIMIGVGSGLFLVGALNFEYIENDKDVLKTEYIEFDMKNDLILDYYIPEIEYIESNNENIKIEYSMNKHCDFNYSLLSNKIVHIWITCDNPIELIKEVITKLNDKKIISISNEIQDIKIYTTKQNIEILKKNYNEYIDNELQTQNIINSYEKRINELHQKIDNYVKKEWEYQEEINDLKNQIAMYKNY